MKKSIVDFLVLSVLCIFLYFVLIFILEKFGINANSIIAGFFLTLFCVSFSYKRLWSRDTFKTNRRIFILVFLSLTLFSASTSVFYIYNESSKLYAYLISERKRGWKGKAHEFDDILGFRPIPYARAFHTFPFGPDIPMAYNNDGFRIPLSDTLKINDENKTDLLFLGCSFTYGDGNLAEETFPYLVAKETSLTYINAGVCSYGLSQMLILAERLIPKYKPGYVIVQHSPWLIQRGVNPFAPVYFGSMPCPYFVDSAEGFSIHPPLYRTLVFDLDADEVKKESFVSFLFKRGFMFYIKDYSLRLKNKINIIFSKNMQPASDADKAELYAYLKIIEIAKKYKSKVIILSLWTEDESSHLKDQISQPDVYFANADSILSNNLKINNTKNFVREYTQWRMKGTDSVNVDPHPNPLAHRLISKSIIQIINKK